MNRFSFLLVSVVVCLPLLANADDLLMDKHLNGLKIDAGMEGNSDSGGQSASGALQALKLTNNDSVAVICMLKPGPAESSDAQSPPAVMAPGESATLRVEGKYTGAPLKASLECHKK
ncbi:hypothetical protein [Pseudomonas sp.]|uniref:hypothetical protein n=1 Tax=Pseudomonas sp. TaxID=306 RepID=UPI00260D4E59|nr:hypothetical protein [Pseudomonas sp.]